MSFENSGLFVDDRMELEDKVLNVSHEFLDKIVYFSVDSKHFSGHDFRRLPLSGWFLSGFLAVH